MTAMSEALVIDVPAALWLSHNKKLHWAETARRTKALRALAYVEARKVGIPALGTTHVAAFIGYPRNGKADPANAAVVKPLIDGLVDAGVWPDDDSTYVLGPTHLRDPKPDVVGVYRVRLVLTAQDVPWGDTA